MRQTVETASLEYFNNNSKYRPEMEEVVRTAFEAGVEWYKTKTNWANMNKIIKTVCSHFSITERELKRKTRKREVVLPRQITMYLAVKHTEISTGKIGSYLGKNRITVLYSFYKIRDLMKTDKELEEQVKQIEEELYGR